MTFLVFGTSLFISNVQAMDKEEKELSQKIKDKITMFQEGARSLLKQNNKQVMKKRQDLSKEEKKAERLKEGAAAFLKLDEDDQDMLITNPNMFLTMKCIVKRDKLTTSNKNRPQTKKKEQRWQKAETAFNQLNDKEKQELRVMLRYYPEMFKAMKFVHKWSKRLN